MYDSLNVVLNIQTPSWIWNSYPMPFELWNLQWLPSYSKKGIHTSYTSYHRNLFFRLLSDKIYCNNSFQKWHVGHNYGLDYGVVEFAQSVNALSEYTGLDFLSAKIVGLEYGWNFQVENPSHIYKSLLSYKGRDFVQMIDRKRKVEYGMQRGGDEFYLKSYNKSLEVLLTNQVKLPFSVLRFEKVITDMTHLTLRKSPILIYYVRDLLETTIVALLMEDLKTSYNNIIKNTVLDYSKLTTKELNAVVLYLNKEAYASRLITNSRSAANTRRAAEKAIKKASIEDDYLSLKWPQDL